MESSGSPIEPNPDLTTEKVQSGIYLFEVQDTEGYTVRFPRATWEDLLAWQGYPSAEMRDRLLDIELAVREPEVQILTSPDGLDRIYFRHFGERPPLRVSVRVVDQTNKIGEVKFPSPSDYLGGGG